MLAIYLLSVPSAILVHLESILFPEQNQKIFAEENFFTLCNRQPTQRRTIYSSWLFPSLSVSLFHGTESYPYMRHHAEPPQWQDTNQQHFQHIVPFNPIQRCLTRFFFTLSKLISPAYLASSHAQRICTPHLHFQSYSWLALQNMNWQLASS